MRAGIEVVPGGAAGSSSYRCCIRAIRPCRQGPPRPGYREHGLLKQALGDTMLSEEEQYIVDTVRDFVDREVRPVVRELEHANTYPERLIEQMKELGVFGLAVPEPYGEVAVSTPCYVQVTEQLARGW